LEPGLILQPLRLEGKRHLESSIVPLFGLIVLVVVVVLGLLAVKKSRTKNDDENDYGKPLGTGRSRRTSIGGQVKTSILGDRSKKSFGDESDSQMTWEPIATYLQKGKTFLSDRSFSIKGSRTCPLFGFVPFVPNKRIKVAKN
jgi:hypothetical protein